MKTTSTGASFTSRVTTASRITVSSDATSQYTTNPPAHVPNRRANIQSQSESVNNNQDDDGDYDDTTPLPQIQNSNILVDNHNINHDSDGKQKNSTKPPSRAQITRGVITRGVNIDAINTSVMSNVLNSNMSSNNKADAVKRDALRPSSANIRNHKQLQSQSFSRTSSDAPSHSSSVHADTYKGDRNTGQKGAHMARSDFARTASQDSSQSGGENSIRRHARVPHGHGSRPGSGTQNPNKSSRRPSTWSVAMSDAEQEMYLQTDLPAIDFGANGDDQLAGEQDEYATQPSADTATTRSDSFLTRLPSSDALKMANKSVRDVLGANIVRPASATRKIKKVTMMLADDYSQDLPVDSSWAGL
jgi:hypothetical protein